MKHVPAILTDRRGARTTVKGIMFNEATGALPEVIRYDERNFTIEHNPAGNTGTYNPPVYREVDTQK